MADLGRWLSGDYRVPGATVDDNEGFADGKPPADDSGDEPTY